MKKIETNFKGTSAEFGVLAQKVAGNARTTSTQFALYTISGAPFLENDNPVVLAFGRYDMEWNDLARVTVTRVNDTESSVQVLAKNQVWAELQPTWALIEKELNRHNNAKGKTSLKLVSGSPKEHPDVRDRNVKIAELWHEGLPNHVIASKIPTSDSTVKRTLKELGLRRRLPKKPKAL